MKKTRFILLSFLMMFALFNTSCKKDIEETPQQQQVEESEGVKSVVSAMRSSNTSNTQNAVSSYFCFEFNYPISLMYSDGSTASIADDNEFAQAIQNQTQTLFIINFVYPFNVTKDGQTITVNDDNDFVNLVNSCQTINNNVPTPTQTFCFDFVYPVTLILDDNTTVVVNNNTEFDNLVMNGQNGHYVVNITYPFDVTQNGTNTTIANSVEFQTLMDSCFSCGGSTGGNVYYAYLMPSYVFDNCLTLDYPVTLVYNDGSTITVNNNTEYDDALMNSTATLYIVDYQYPFTVTQNGSTVTINDINGLYDALNTCCSGNPNGNVSFTDSLCFEFVYPVTLVYNDGTTLTVNNNTEMDDAVSRTNNTQQHHVDTFQYNISVIQNGATIVVHNDQEFQQLLDSCYNNPNQP
jgi:hypothetical protein